MTGQEHYEQAERLLVQVCDDDGTPPNDAGEWSLQTIAVAQVHATLALAQAVAMIAGNYGTDFGYTREVSA